MIKWLPSIFPINKKRVSYLLGNWKLGIHLVFYTRKFGVNNKWKSDFDSMFSWTVKQRIISIIKVYPLIDNLRKMEFRARACHFLSDDSYFLVYGRNKEDVYR